MTADLKSQIEALLFASGRRMTLEELKIHLNVSSAKMLQEALQELQNEYEQRQSPIMVVQEGDSWKLTTREKYLQIVRKIYPNTELTKSMMETLAVVAWKQPITQSEVIAIRTNKAYEHIGELEKMGFLIKEKYGRTYMLKLTQKFFDYFDLRDAHAARDMFAHVKESEETQKKLEEVRAVADAEANTAEEKHEEAVLLGEEDAEIENVDDRQEMVEEDEIQPEEASFVQGYEKDALKTLDHSIVQPITEKKKKKQP